MKRNISVFQRATAGLMLVVALPALAQTVVKETRETTRPGLSETTTTTTTGTVSSFGDERLVVRTESSTEPLSYRFTETTTYVDEAGAPVSVELVKSGLPVTVHYATEGDARIAKKVIVKKRTTTPGRTTETTTTTSTGTISEFGGERLVIRSETSTTPLTYRFAETTTYVDESGAPVSIETVKSGLPVTVHYVTEGDARIAKKVVVKKKTSTAAGTTETTTATTTSAGTISEFGNDRLVIRSESYPDPLSYRFSETTTYVDESGAPVSVETVKSGLPVTVHYVKEGDARIAKKVVVKKKTTTSGKTTETTSTTTTSTGTISSFGDERLVVRTTSSTEPVSYRSSETTTYVDESGAPVTIETVKSGLPVTVHYIKEGDALVARKVVVKKKTTVPGSTNETTTTTTTTTGTISSFGDERLVVRTETSTEPLSYRFTETTTYVDEAGAPVSIETVKSGLPVTVQYIREGDALIAQKVIVKKTTTKRPPSVTRTKKTETTAKVEKKTAPKPAPPVTEVKEVPAEPPLVKKTTETTTTTTRKP